MAAPQPPPYPPGAGLLEGRTVVVTAAAGAGIGAQGPGCPQHRRTVRGRRQV